MPEPQFVADISANHIVEGKRQLINLHSLWPNRKIVVFDLGLGEHREEYENDPLVDFRDFHFDKHPKFMRNLFEFRWKPIIIAEMINEFGAIFYIDALIMFHYPDLNPIYNLYRCKNKKNSLIKTVPRPKYLENSKIDEMLSYCNKSSHLFHSQTYHIIFSTTQTGMYNYLPINMDLATTVVMREANSTSIVRTKEVVENIIKWYVLCALEKNCITPQGPKLPCSFKLFNTLTAFADCHR